MKPAPKYLPVLTLLLMAPIFGELLSGCQNPQQFFFKKTSCLLAVCLYGSGAVLARELVIRWKKGWLSLLLLGAAYGILEEGLAMKYFFDPACPFMAPNFGYGRLAGVNWVMTLRVTVFHAIFSISIPVALVHLMFPKLRREPWVNKWVFMFLAALLLAVSVFMFFVATPYRPPLFQYSLTWIVFILLLVLARRLPREPFKKRSDRSRVPAWLLLLLGLLTTTLFFIIGFILPNVTRIPAGATMLLMVGLVGLGFWLFLYLSGNGGVLKARQRFALAAGVMMFFILIQLLSLNQKKVENQGKPLVGLAGLVFVVAMARQARRVEKWEATEASDDPGQPEPTLSSL